MLNMTICWAPYDCHISSCNGKILKNQHVPSFWGSSYNGRTVPKHSDQLWTASGKIPIYPHPSATNRCHPIDSGLGLAVAVAEIRSGSHGIKGFCSFFVKKYFFVKTLNSCTWDGSERYNKLHRFIDGWGQRHC